MIAKRCAVTAVLAFTAALAGLVGVVYRAQAIADAAITDPDEQENRARPAN